MVQSIQNLCLIYQNADDQFIDAHYMQILRFFLLYESRRHNQRVVFDDILDEELTIEW